MERENNIEAIIQLINLPNPPDAVFCFNDYVAYDALQILKEQTNSFLRSILVVGYANQPVSTYMQPTLTSIDQDAYKIGQKSIEMMLKFLSGDNLKKENNTVLLETKLIIRQSSINF